MTHKYRVGDQIRMLTDYGNLKKGKAYTVVKVDGKDPGLPVRVGEDGETYWPHTSQFELVTDAPQDNTDLTENLIQLDLLEPDVQKRMKAWPHGWSCWSSGYARWIPITDDKPYKKGMVYRALPAPVAPERVTRWLNVYLDGSGGTYLNRAHADVRAAKSRIAVWRITYDEDTGLNPVIEVEDV